MLSKLLEQHLQYQSDHNLLPDRQSAYQTFHSIETTVDRLLSDILLALDSGDIVALTLLNLPVAFDHETLPLAKFIQSMQVITRLIHVIP